MIVSHDLKTTSSNRGTITLDHIMNTFVMPIYNHEKNTSHMKPWCDRIIEYIHIHE